jgi:thiamine-monophosphate kinase
MRISDLTELELVARIQSRLPSQPAWVIVGLGDDAAVVETEQARLEVLSTDALVEGVHFDRRFTPPSAIGHRALAVNLSDLAAMGALPRLALVSLVLPAALECTDFDGIADGLTSLAALHRLHIVGGNLSRSPGPLIVDVTVVGTVKRRDVLTRAGARPGDALYVSGTIGAAAAGLGSLRGETVSRDARCVERYLRPEPRVRAGVLIGRNRAASAAIDLSDGLADGVRQIAAASGVGAVIDANCVPIDPGARAWAVEHFGSTVDVATWALASGDDYELLVAVPPRRERRFRAAIRQAGLDFTRVGECTPERDLRVRRSSGDAPLPSGYTHFGSR